MNYIESDEHLYDSYNIYINNIRYFANLFNYKFIHPLELNDRNIDNWTDGNPYLLSLESKQDLGYDVLENGMHFPFIIDSDKYVLEGRHRIAALKSIQLPDDLKLLCLEIDARHFEQEHEVGPHWDIAKCLQFPLEQLLKKKTNDELKLGFQSGEFRNTNNFKFVDIYTADQSLYCDYLVQFGCWFAPYIYSYNLKNTKKFKGWIGISDKQYFTSWL